MSRVALLSSEPLRPRMAGIGIRYMEFARRLQTAGLEVVVLCAGEAEAAAELDLGGAELRPFRAGALARSVADCDVAVAQGQLANDLLLEVRELPTVIDLYDPWLVENLHYRSTLGTAPYQNDHATWVLQLSGGDFFLCSSTEQRLFYLGFLTAVGRVNPERLDEDPDLSRLITPVPFGIPEEIPPHRPLLDDADPGQRRLLFGGLYDWYDPMPLLEALEASGSEGWKLLMIRNPNPASTPQQRFLEVERWCRRRGWWGSKVEALDWFPFDRRYDLLRDVDCLVSTHRSSLETELSLRTRFLDALAVGCPVLTSAGGTVSRLLEEWRAGWVVAPGSSEAIAAALGEIFDDPQEARRRAALGKELVGSYSWPRVLAPLIEFCREPRRDRTKDRFAHRPSTVVPAPTLFQRLRRRLQRQAARGS